MTTKTSIFPISAHVSVPGVASSNQVSSVSMQENSNAPGAAPGIPGKIQKVTGIGCLIELEKPLALGQQVKLGFQVPKTDEFFSCVAVVVKNYTRMGGEPGKSKSHSLSELHFRQLGDKDRIVLDRFLHLLKK